MSAPRVPPGYLRVDLPHARVIVRADLRDGVEQALRAEGAPTLHAIAERQPKARPLAGRGVAWAAALPGTGLRAVVRHNRHGGVLAPLTGDLFLPPTRAPRELATALRLAASGISTPEVLAIAVYPAALGLLARSDVATREIEGAVDLGELLLATEPGDARRAAGLRAGGALLEALFRVGARHHDLNVKNLLLAGDPHEPEAVLLDVDRVTFHRPESRTVSEANRARLRRSLDKWSATRGVRHSAHEAALLLDNPRHP